MAMNLGMLTSYDEIKEQMNEWKGTHDDLQTRVLASAVAGVICSFLSLPFDNVKVKNLIYFSSKKIFKLLISSIIPKIGNLSILK